MSQFLKHYLKRRVSTETRDNVLKVAEELGYSKIKKLDFSELHKTILIIVSEKFFSDSSFYSNLYATLLQRLTLQGFTTILEIVTQTMEYSNHLPSSLENPDIAGVIFMGEISRSYIDETIKSNLPYCFLDFYDPNYAVNSVVSDSMTGSFLLTKHLIDKGLKNIAFVGSIDKTSSIMDRFLGYSKAMILNNLENNVIHLEDRDKDGKFIPVTLPNKIPEAFVCNCDEIAFRYIQCLRDHNYKVPTNVSVVGFDGSVISSISTPTISTYVVDVKSMADVTVSIMSRLVRQKEVTIRRNIIAGNMTLRDSSL